MQVTILGITGGVGRAVADAFLHNGWTVRALARTPSAVSSHPQLTVIAGDANDAQALDRALDGSQVVFHGLNLPYPEWDPGMADLTSAVIAASERAGATILFPGNVYGLGPDFSQPLDEDSSFEPVRPKGVLRNRLERMLEESHSPSIVLRMGDFFGGIGESNWMHHLTSGARAGGVLRYPGAHDVLHTWCYLPDAAKAFVMLAERREELPNHASFHFEGHVLDGTAWLTEVQNAIGPRSIRAFPWMWMQLARPFVPMVRSLFEMRYLWSEPVRMRGDKLTAFLGDVPHTPFAHAIRETLLEEVSAAA